MFENIWNSRTLKVSIVSIIFIIIIILAVPPTKDNKEVSLRNENTGEKEFKQQINEAFIGGLLLAVILPLILISSLDQSSPTPKRLSLPQIWSKITKDELIKFELQDVMSILMTGDYFYGQSSRNKNVYHLRYTDQGKNAIINIALYTLDDFSKFMTSPLFGITTMPMGLDSAQTRMIKTQDTASRVVQTAQTIGITPEEVRRRLLEKEIEAQSKSVEGDSNDESR